MTLASFRKIVWAMSRTEGTPYLKPTDTEEFNDLVQEGLDVYTAGSHCLQADNIAFTPIVGYSSYDVGKTSLVISGVTTTYLTYRLCYVRQVMINGAYLASFKDLYGRPGPSSEFAMTMEQQAFLTASNGAPAFWWQESPTTLRFDKPFDQIYSNCFIAGRKYHSQYTASDSADIELGIEDRRPAAALCASMLLLPNAPDKAMALMSYAEAKMKQRKAEVAERQAGSSSRGTPVPIETVNMSRGGQGSNPRWRR